MKDIPILVLLDCLYGPQLGGTEKQFLKFNELANKWGIDVQTLFLRKSKLDLSLESLDFAEVLDLHKLTSIDLIRSAKRVRQILAEKKIRVLQSYYDDAALLSALVKVLDPSLTFVCMQRNIGHHRNFFQKLLFRQIFKIADRVCANSEGVAAVLKGNYGVSENKLAVIDNIHEVDSLHKAKVPDQMIELRRNLGFVGVCVANLRPVKGVVDLVHAVALLRKAGTMIGVALVGEGPERRNIESCVRSLDLEDQISICGYSQSPLDFIQSADFAILPSRAEGASNSLIEYMLAERVVVATDVGGNPDFLCHGEYGWLAPPGDPAGLAIAIHQMLANIDVAREKATMGKKYAVDRFGQTSVMKNYREFFESLTVGG